MEAFPRRMTALLIGGLLALATLAGCGSGEPAAVAEPLSLPAQAPDPAQRCGFTGEVEKVELTTADGVKLAGARLGSGAHGIVLMHQVGSDMCGWNTAASALVESGFHLLAIDFRCVGYSECDQTDNDDWQDGTHDFAEDGAAAIKELKRAGATKVAVMGASMGAAIAVVTAGRFADQVSAVVGLSVFSMKFNASGATTTDVHTPDDAGAHITSPALIAGARGDPGAIAPDTAQAIIDQGPAKAAGKVIDQDGSTHGWDLLRSPDVFAQVRAFLKANT